MRRHSTQGSSLASPMTVPVSPTSTPVEPREATLIPIAQRLYPLYLKLDPKRFLSDSEFNKVCQVVAGDKRRIIERVLLGIYQRAQTKKDFEEVKRVRLYLGLHENEDLERNLGE